MNPNDRLPDDADLVAWLDGELPTETASTVARAVAGDATLQRKVALLRAGLEELTSALRHPDGSTVSIAAMSNAAVPNAAPPPETQHTPPAGRQLGLWLVAAAGILVVIALNALMRTESSVAVSNEWLEFRVLPTRPGWQLHCGIQFDLDGRAKTATPCRIVARNNGETDEQLANRVLDEHDVVPLLLEAEVTGPDGIAHRGRVARVEGQFGQTATRLRVELVDVVLPHLGISPLVAAALQENGCAEDFQWGIARVGSPDVDGVHGFVPELPGEYRISFSLRSFTAPGAGFPVFAQPLIAATGFSIRGAVGDWSLPVDGMCARIAASASHVQHGSPLAIALQLQNGSDRARSLDLAGVTMAPIPQPFHFDLVIDGETWTQREDLDVIIPARSEGLPQAAGTRRSVIVLADYWQQGASPGRDARRPSQLVGPHRVALRLHFQALVRENGDQELWQGRIETPPVEIDFGTPR